MSLEYQCETCKNWFPSSEWLKTHQRIYFGEETHKDEEKDSLVDWLEQWNNKEALFEVKNWIEEIDPDDPGYRNISIIFIQYGIDMEMLKDKTLFNREHINDIVIKYDSKLDSLYTSKIWEKILILRE